MPQKNIINIKSYKRKSALLYLVNTCKYGWTGKLDNIIDYEWHRNKKNFQKLENTKFCKIFIKIMTFVNLILCIYLVYLLICNYL